MKSTVCLVFCVRSSDVLNENLFSISRSRVQLVVEISQYKYQHQGDMPTSSKHAADTLTLYVTNDEESAEPSRAIQIDTDQVNRIKSTYLNTKEIDDTSSNSCLENSKEQNQIEVKSCYSQILP